MGSQPPSTPSKAIGFFLLEVTIGLCLRNPAPMHVISSDPLAIC
ncbi:MAG: hypothetical protein ACFBSF_12430 [Leptolyngbyaceae cyanobacterium]